jgi:3'-phosphoadenosine 5'-phosphosulfate sulfotransferase (PAPS reductase)/FAD synthetase
MTTLDGVIAAAEKLLAAAIEEYSPRYIIALFSGGHDSVVATHIASRLGCLDFACHIDTGIGVPETRKFVADFCASQKIALRTYGAATYRTPAGALDPQRYRDFIREHGFPGPAMHTKMYNRLKERPLRQMIRELDRRKNDRVMLVSGLRSSESARRGRYASAVHVWEGTKLWVAPAWDFSKLDVSAYIEQHGLPRNPVVDAIHKSGECLCGAFARSGEKEELAFWYPEVAGYIDELECEARALGFEWGWGERPPAKRRRRSVEGIMCSSCAFVADTHDLQRESDAG